MFAIFIAQISFHTFFSKDIKTRVVRETHQIFKRKGGSQDLKRRQVSNAFRNGARQIIRTEVSAPEYTYTSWVRCQIQWSPQTNFQVILPSSILATLINPFNAHNGSIETRIPTWK